MKNLSNLIVVTGLSALGATATAHASIRDLVRGHSHNDYAQKHPLHDALDQRFYSVEADIWLRKGRILVSHIGLFFKGSLKDLYLDPLQKIVERQGSVHGDGREFILWLDIKDGSAGLRAELYRLLSQYSMFTIFDGEHTVRGAVTVVLTGDEKSKARFVEEFPIRKATRDSNYLSVDDSIGDDRWSWYALNWTDFMHWNGGRPITSAEQERLEKLIHLAHVKGRKLRFWGLPAREDVWRAVFKAGADQLSADDLPRMRRFLEASVNLASQPERATDATDGFPDNQRY